MILFTSGSSGLPKAVELSRRAVIANQHNVLAVTKRLPHQLNPAAPQSVSLASTPPMFHVGGLSNLLSNYLTGGRVVIPEGRFDAGQILGLIEREGVHSWGGGVPTMAIRVLEHPTSTRSICRHCVRSRSAGRRYPPPCWTGCACGCLNSPAGDSETPGA